MTFCFLYNYSRIDRICTESLLMMLPTLLTASLAASFTWWSEREQKWYFGMNGNWIRARLEHHKIIKTSVCVCIHRQQTHTFKWSKIRVQYRTTSHDFRWLKIQMVAVQWHVTLLVKLRTLACWSLITVQSAGTTCHGKKCKQGRLMIRGKKRSAATLRLRLQNWNTELSIYVDLSIEYHSLQFINNALW